MSHHFIDRLEQLRGQLARMSAMVQSSMENATQALLSVDGRLAQSVIEQDVRIDDEEVRIESTAIDLLALHQPAAVDLRRIATIIKANGDFERIADCAVNVSHRVIFLASLASYDLPPDLRVMGTSVVETLRQTIQAFNQSDEGLARRVLNGDDVVDALCHQVFAEAITRLQSSLNEPAVNLANIMIAKNFERIADHCTNVAEDVVYVHTGRIIRHRHALEQR